MKQEIQMILAIPYFSTNRPATTWTLLGEQLVMLAFNSPEQAEAYRVRCTEYPNFKLQSCPSWDEDILRMAVREGATFDRRDESKWQLLQRAA
jgi:hypothetical protein